MSFAIPSKFARRWAIEGSRTLPQIIRDEVAVLELFNAGRQMNRMKVRDPDHWRECATNARDEAKRLSDPEERGLWLQLAEACESFANDIEKRQTSDGRCPQPKPARACRIATRTVDRI